RVDVAAVFEQRGLLVGDDAPFCSTGTPCGPISVHVSVAFDRSSGWPLTSSSYVPRVPRIVSSRSRSVARLAEAFEPTCSGDENLRIGQLLGDGVYATPSTR